MNRSLIAIMFISLSFSLWSKVITKQISFSNLTVEDGSYNQILKLENTKNVGAIGMPILPYKASSFVLPKGHKIKSVEVKLLGSPIHFPNISLEPAQGVKPLSSTTKFKFQKNEEFYRTNTLFPTESLADFRTDYLRGIPVGMFTFTPIQYNPAKKEVFFYNKCELKITTVKNTTTAIRKGYIQENDLEMLSKMVENPATLSAYSNRFRSSPTLLILINELPDDNAIIDELLLFYKQKGYLVETLDIVELENNFTGRDNAEKMRNAIIDRFENTNLRHVLLAGDTDLLPYRGMYGTVESSFIYEDENIPSDLYFSALDGSWDDNNNDIWGEIGEDDLLPDVSVARLPFSTMQEAENMIHKILSYQNNPVENELTKPLSVGEHLYDDPLTWGSDYLDLLIGYQDENGYETTGIPTTDNIVTLHDRDDGIWNPNGLFAFLNNGGSFIHHAGHSNWNYAMRLYNPDITNENFYNLDGETHNYQFLYTHGCICGSFESNDCIAEEMLKIENFLHTFIGNSRYGWFNEGQTEGPSAHLHREFVNALYNLKEDEVGEAHRLSKIATAPWVTAPGQHEPGALRWCFYDCNVLGDPTLRLRTTEPVEITAEMDNIILSSQENFTFNLISSTGNYENIIVTLHTDQIIASGTFNANEGSLPLENFPTAGTIGTLSITGENVIPIHYPVYFFTENNSNIVVSEYSFSDEEISFITTPTLSLTLQNIGLEPSSNVQVTASCENSFITVSENVVPVGNFESLEEISIEDAFYIGINPNIPNNTNAEILLHITATNGTWETTIPISVFAPDFIIGNISYLDSDDSFSALNPNENIEAMLTLQNVGNVPASDITINLMSENATISEPTTIESLTSLESIDLVFDVEIANTVEMGGFISFDGTIAYQGATKSFEFELPIGLEFEDFSSQNFDQYPWKTIQHGWRVNGNSQNYYAKAVFSEIFQTSSLYLTVEAVENNTFSFDYQCLADGQDRLIFLLDNEPVSQWMGENEWQTKTITMPVGHHVLEWRFERDAGEINVQSTAKIDNISMHAILPQEDFITTDVSEMILPFDENENGITQSIALTNNADEDIDVTITKLPINRALHYFATQQQTYTPGQENNFHLRLFNQDAPITELTLSFPEGTTILQANNFAENTEAYLNADIQGNMISWDGSLPANELGVSFLQLFIPPSESFFKINYNYLTNEEEYSGAILYEHDLNWLTFSENQFTLGANSTENISLSANWDNLTISQDYKALLHIYPEIGNSIFLPITLENVVENDPSPDFISNNLQAYPNPFNPITTIAFTVQHGEIGELSIFNVRGQIILQKDFEAGQHKYVWNAEQYGSGIYFYRLKTNSFSKVKKLLMMK